MSSSLSERGYAEVRGKRSVILRTRLVREKMVEDILDRR
jgi:hypothetical protein